MSPARWRRTGQLLLKGGGNVYLKAAGAAIDSGVAPALLPGNGTLQAVLRTAGASTTMLYQDVVLPVGGLITAQATVALVVAGAGTETTDFYRVDIVEATPATLVLGTTASNSQATFDAGVLQAMYVHNRSADVASQDTPLFDISAYAGQTVRIRAITNAQTNYTQGVLDNVRIIGGLAQTIVFGAAPTIVVDGTGTVSATGGASGNPVTFSSQTTGVCTVAGSTVTGISAGTCTIAANQAGSSPSYSPAAQVTQSFSIGQGSQSITFGAAPTIVVAGSGSVSATGGASGNPVTFSSQTTGVCTVAGSTVTGVSAGTCTIAANQASNSNYTAAPQVTQSFSIGQGSQSITFGAAPTIVVAGSGSVSATGGASGNPVTFSSQTTGVCTVAGSTVTGVSAGTCTIAANQASNSNYTAAPQVTQSFSIGQGSQSITFGAAPTIVVAGTGAVSATGGASGNPVTFSSQTTGVCTVAGSTVTGVGAGTCTIAANQAGTSNYTAAPQVTQSFSIGQGSQSITFGAAPTIVFPGTGAVSATGGASGNPVTFSSQTTGVCTVAGSTVTGVGAGTCTIAANQAGTSNYTAAPQVTQSFSIGQGSQSITFGAAPTIVFPGTGAVSATGGASGNPVTFTSQTTGVCTVAGSTVTGVSAGTCTIAANQAGTSNYTAAPQVTQSFSIGQGSQSITFGVAPTIRVASSGVVSATGGASGNPVVFTSSTPNTCAVSGSNGATVTGVAVGTCTIAANQAGNANYTAAPQQTQSFTIGAAAQLSVGGTLNGYVGSGLVLRLNGATDLPVNSGTVQFSFPTIADGSSYQVTVATNPVQPTQVCSVSNGQGTLAGANVSQVVVTCQTTAQPPGPPTNVQLNISGTTATISWTMPAGDGGWAITGYRATLQPGGQSCEVTGNPPPTSCQITGLQPNLSYTVTVVSGNGTGFGAPGTASGSTPAIIIPVDQTWALLGLALLIGLLATRNLLTRAE